jgi:hypothetical protein
MEPLQIVAPLAPDKHSISNHLARGIGQDRCLIDIA